MSDNVVDEIPWAPERAALDSAQREMERSGVWVEIDEWHLLAQAHGRLCRRSRASTVRDRALEIIGALGDLDLVVEGCKVRDREPAFVVALALELARRWRSRTGTDREHTVSDAVRAKLAATILARVNQFRPEGFITITEAARLLGVHASQVRRTLRGFAVEEVAAGGFVFLRVSDLENYLASRADGASCEP